MVKTRSQAASAPAAGTASQSTAHSAVTVRAEIAEAEAEHARRLAAVSAERLEQERAFMAQQHAFMAQREEQERALMAQRVVQEHAVAEAEFRAKIAAIRARSSTGSRADSSRGSRAASRSSRSIVDKWLDDNIVTTSPSRIPGTQIDNLCPQITLPAHNPAQFASLGDATEPAASGNATWCYTRHADDARGVAFANVAASSQPPSPRPLIEPRPLVKPPRSVGPFGAHWPRDTTGAARTTDGPAHVTTLSHAYVGTPTLNCDKIINPSPNTDINTLAEAIQRLAQQPAPRRVSDLPLPTYTGSPTEWLHFYRQYKKTESYFNDVENLNRISTALKGAAREAVAPLLISCENPSLVMSALQRQYGNTELIVLQVIREVRALPKLGYDVSREINSFACRIRNCVETIRLLDHPEHMANPELVNSILVKLTPLLKEKWLEFAFSRQQERKFKLEILSEFLLHEADIHLRFGMPTENLCQITSGQKMSHVSGRSEKVHLTEAKENTNSSQPTSSKVGQTSKVDSPESKKSTNRSCHYCQSNTHDIGNCDNFSALTMDHRLQWVKEKKVCWRCLKRGHHTYKSCKKTCKKCKKNHHTLLHPDDEQPDAELENVSHATSPPTQLPPSGSGPDLQNITHVALPSHKPSRTLLKVLPVTVKGPKGSIDTFALLDDGSSATFIDSSLSAQIGAIGPKAFVEVNCVGGLSKTTPVEYVELKIKGRRKDLPTYTLHRVRSVSDLAIARQTLVTKDLDYDHLVELKHELCYNNAQPMMIIGIDNWHLTLPLETRQGTKSQPVACRTALGWVIFGFTSSKTRPISFDSHNVLHIQLPNEHSETERLDQLVNEHFKLDSLGVQKKEYHSLDDERAIKLLRETTHRLPSGQFETGLPWKSDAPIVPDSYPLALSRFLSLEKKLVNDEAYAQSYKAQIHGMIGKQYAELCTDPPQIGRVTWYLPHFGVVHPQKKKLRLVHDAAALTKGVSLNSLLLSGPDLLQPLLAILMRFREGRVALNGDIREMFPQTKIRTEDRDAQRFLWRDTPSETLREYRMSSMIFGASSSPFTALYLKNLNAEQYKETFPAAAAAIVNDHYMDDFLGSVNTIQEAAQLAADIVYVHSKACLEMRSWVSNCKEALSLIPDDLRAPNAIEVGLINPTATVKVLGVAWNVSTDTLGFRNSTPDLSNTKWTKRSVLSHLMRVYDPLGLLTPITIRGRILFQQLWRHGAGWDDELPKEILSKWISWFQRLAKLATATVPRCYFPTQNSKDIQLHLLADASELAYCCVAYWRLSYEDGSVRLSLIGGKAKLAPLKPTSIPRLELQAALIAARFAQYITQAHRWKPSATYFWSDSLTVLKWLRSDARTFKAFVAYRVGEISELTDISSWRYVPTALNVADDATRVQSKFEIDRWLSGPQFLLKNPVTWPQEPSSSVLLPPNELKHQEVVALTTDTPTPEPPSPVVADYSRFSRWLRLLRATARAHVCAKVLLATLDKYSVPHRQIPNSPHLLSASDIMRAETHLLRQSQAVSFKEEITFVRRSEPLPKHSRLKNFTMFIDEDDLLRLSSRILSAKEISPCMDVQPVVLDGHNPIVRLMLAHLHQKNAHANTELIVNEVRLRFHILHLRPTVRSVASQCRFCRIRKAVPQVPPLGDLPQGRLAHHTRPFTHVGLDYFGPVSITVGRRHIKKYVALFTCLTVRAVHLETVESLSSDAALMALRRFIARRGCPSHIYSDNGTAFVGAANQLPELYDFAANRKITWHFITPLAPFMGGCWERMVKSVKTALRVTLKDRAPREEVFQTFLLEAEATINSRPLTHVAVGTDDDEALTPFHFLLGGIPNDRPLKSLTDADLCRRQDYKKGLRLADHFWQRWTREVLPCLVPRRPGSQTDIKCGDVVVIVDGSLPRSSWPRGRVVKTYPGKDGRVRTADVATKGGTFKRAVRLLALLPVDANAAHLL